MRMILATLVAALAGLAGLAANAQQAGTKQASPTGETVIAGLSQNQVSINATFVGSEILIFGAVKRDAPPPPDAGPLGVVVVVEGPSHPITVRKIARRMGIWVNTDPVVVDSAPSFYAIATSGPLSEVLSNVDDLRYHITIPRTIRLVGESDNARNIAEYAQAVIRIRSEQGLYVTLEGAVDLKQDTLFDTSIALPSNLTEGEYTARVYLTRGGHVIADQAAAIHVRKVGVERFLYNLAHEHALIYGLLSLVIAVAAGWSASAAFRVLLRG